MRYDMGEINPILYKNPTKERLSVSWYVFDEILLLMSWHT